MRVLSICATCGRHTCLERSVKMFIDQDYWGEHTLLIFNNSDKELTLDTLKLPHNKTIVLVNSTQTEYTNLGQIYNDTLPYIEEDECDLVTFWDDDDIFLPNHISEGVRGFYRALENNPLVEAYKPKKSLYRHAGGVEEAENTLEPSMFIKASVILEAKFKETTSDQHLNWLNHLGKNKSLVIDPFGVSTLVYNWGDTDIPTWKTSGNPANPENFNNYRNFSKEHGDLVITPISDEAIGKYYKQVEDSKKPKE